MSDCFRNSSLTIIWNNLGLSNYNRMKKKLGLKKTTTKNTCYNFKKELFSPLFKREPSYSDAFVASLNHSIVLGRIICWTFIERCFLKYVYFSKFKIPIHTIVIRQTQIIPNDSDELLKQRDTEAFLKFDSCFLLNLNAKKTRTSPKNCCNST